MSATTPRILSYGSINIDVTARAHRLPRPGETVHADGYETGLGGKGANQAAAASRLGQGCGLAVGLAGRIGTDSFGADARRLLTPFGVDTTALRETPGHPTGIALITVDAAAENTITVAGGANMALDEKDVARDASLIRAASTLLLQLEIPLAVTLAAAEAAREAGTSVILDPAPAPAEALPERLLRQADFITPNESETRLLTGIYPETEADAARAARQLQAMGAAGAVVKMGARGVFYRRGEEEGFVAPFRVEAIDSVAAGDCFNAGLAVALTLGLGLSDCVRFAAGCGALATTRRGAASAAPFWNDVAGLTGLASLPA
ncbi:ribokinase [Swaminathania salitolerans]|uniref:Ribokinase n=1 Tax=Swaminathania salitolerans TaxID=182838 RepID=A0A511BSK2_9PROT|nr:ribokinase [Swaminathania salitolerans]GBQ13275.1 ribokinase [Swaminathania salitolerans LMG 21291]GEL03265.1 ribokinase [Swaminathania salitolerans]